MVMTGQDILWNGNLRKVVSGIVVNVPDKDFLVSSTSDKEGFSTFFNSDASGSNARNIGLVTINELCREEFNLLSFRHGL